MGRRNGRCSAVYISRKPTRAWLACPRKVHHPVARQAVALFLIAPMIAVSMAPPAPPAITCEMIPSRSDCPTALRQTMKSLGVLLCALARLPFQNCVAPHENSDCPPPTDGAYRGVRGIERSRSQSFSAGLPESHHSADRAVPGRRWHRLRGPHH